VRIDDARRVRASFYVPELMRSTAAAVVTI
jgi:hypothetical protein